MRLPTVRVVNPSQPDSYVIINESDFVQGKHQLYDSPPLNRHAGAAVAREATEHFVAEIKQNPLVAELTQATENTEITPREAQPVGASRIAGADDLRGSYQYGGERGEGPLEFVPHTLDDLRVAKGPGGKWYVWRGKQIVSGRLDSEDAALDALQNMREPVA